MEAYEQYDILQWVWNLAKKYEDEEDAIQKFRDNIRKILGVIAEEGTQDFRLYLTDLKKGLY